MRHRIAELRRSLGLSQTEFAGKLRMSRSFFNQVETGRKAVSDRTIADICRVFHVREEWLRDGRGEIFAPKSREEQIDAFIRDALSGEAESFKASLIAALCKLPPSDWDALEHIYNLIADPPKDE